LASLLTGQWPQRHGIFYNVGPRLAAPEHALPLVLQRAGYATYQGGKFWEEDAQAFGFRHSSPKGRLGFARKGQDDLFRFLRETPDDQPLFVWWAPQIPHAPNDAPQRFWDLFKRDAIAVPTWFEGEPEIYRELEHTQLAMGAWFDDCLGQLLEVQRSARDPDNTLFVFVNDNGLSNGHVSKGAPTEKGHRTPVIFTWGERLRRPSSDVLVSTLDVYPTILDLLDLNLPAQVQGISLRPALEGSGPIEREVLCGADFRRVARSDDLSSRANVFALYARTKRWKYVLYLKKLRHTVRQEAIYDMTATNAYPLERDRGDENLYDLENDPYEQKDLSAREENQGLVQVLRGQALGWWSESGGSEIKLP
jgi:arylsulfatase A-like enzyme